VRSARENDPLNCSFCRKRGGRVRRLFASPSDAQSCICDECIAACNAILDTSMGDPAKQVGALSVRCSFCKKPADAVRKLISSPKEYARCYICDECVSGCNSILTDERVNWEPSRSSRRGAGWLASLLSWREWKPRGPHRRLATRPS
jgi:ATP-dependent protease Clp ATPase subunit